MATKKKKMLLGDRIRKRRTRIDLEMKMDIINKYEEGESVSSISLDYGLASSTVSTIIKDAMRIKEHVALGSASLKSTIITKKRSLAITEMEKILTVWMKIQIKENAELSLKTIRTKAISIFEEMNRKYPESSQSFLASNGWFARYKKRAGLNNIHIAEDTDSTYTEIQQEPLQIKLEEHDMDESMDSTEEESFKWDELEQDENIKLEFPENTEVSETSEVVKTPRDFVTEEMLMAFREISTGLSRLERAFFTMTKRQSS